MSEIRGTFAKWDGEWAVRVEAEAFGDLVGAFDVTIVKKDGSEKVERVLADVEWTNGQVEIHHLLRNASSSKVATRRVLAELRADGEEVVVRNGQVVIL